MKRERERKRGRTPSSKQQQQNKKKIHTQKQRNNKETKKQRKKQTNKETNKRKETKRKKESNASTVLPILFASKRKLKNKKNKNNNRQPTNQPTNQPNNKNEQQQQTPSTADKFCYCGCLIPLKLSGPIEIVCPCTVDKLCMQEKWTTPKGAFFIHWTNTTIFITLLKLTLVRYKNPSHLYKLQAASHES